MRSPPMQGRFVAGNLGHFQRLQRAARAGGIGSQLMRQPTGARALHASDPDQALNRESTVFL